ncbi:MAG: polyprenol monophosphomannose synthase [bacterium]|nr:polyprenol monophosphomannose synthase [bacterium]
MTNSETKNSYSKSLIVIPTLNEKENLAKLLPEIFQSMENISIIVIDDSSSDGTIELLNKFKNLYPHLQYIFRESDFGYGRSILTGLKWSYDNNFIRTITMDADFSHNPSVVPDLLVGLSRADVIIGSRYINGGAISSWNFYRRALSRFANWYARTILSIKFRDLTTGFVGYNRLALEKIIRDSPKSEGYAFLIETKNILYKNNLKIEEFPIIFSERRQGQSKMSTKVVWESIWNPWKLRFSPKD